MAEATAHGPSTGSQDLTTLRWLTTASLDVQSPLYEAT
jgi:hypothetical protein